MPADTKEHISSQPQVRALLVPSSVAVLNHFRLPCKKYRQLLQWQRVETEMP